MQVALYGFAIASGLVVSVITMLKEIRGKEWKHLTRTLALVVGIVSILGALAKQVQDTLSKQEAAREAHAQATLQKMRDDMLKDIQKVVVHSQTMTSSIQERLQGMELSSLGVKVEAVDFSGDPLAEAGKASARAWDGYANHVARAARAGKRVALELQIGAGRTLPGLLVAYAATGSDTRNYLQERIRTSEYNSARDFEGMPTDARPAVRLIVFRGHDGSMLGFADAQAFYRELLAVGLTIGWGEQVMAALNDPQESTFSSGMKRLFRSYRDEVFPAPNAEVLVEKLLASNTSEALVSSAGALYHVELASIVRLATQN